MLTPLFAGRTLPPPLPETYELMASAWIKSEVRPSVENLAAVDAGVRLFPRDADLVYSDALLQAAIHRDAAAAALCNLGARFAPDAASRQRFIDLKASLAATAAHPP